MRAVLTSLLQGLAAGALGLALLIAPVRADALPIEKPSEAEAKELREWFQNLPKERQDTLRKRLRAFGRLAPKRQKEIIEKLKGKDLAFSEQQSRAMGSLQKLPFVARVRLHMFAEDLAQLQKRDAAAYERIMALPEKERARELNQRILMGRMGRHRMSLGEDERKEFDKLRPPERLQRYLQAKRERVNALLEFSPRYKDLSALAAKGDLEAKKNLGVLTRDISTLDDLMERYAPEIPAEKREELRVKLREAIAKDGFEKGNNALRQFGKQLKDNRIPKRPEDREGDRKPMISPDRDRPRREK